MKGDVRGAVVATTDTGPKAMRALVGSCIGMFLNPSPLVLLSFGVYLLPIVRDTGWSRDFVASSIAAAMIVIGLSPPLVGYLINRYGVHRVSSIGFPLCGLGMILLATPTSPAMFVAALALFGVLAAGQTSIAYIYCLSGWFDRRRGFVLGLGLACSGLAIAIIPPAAAQLIGLIGWRATYAVVGSIVFLVAVPVSRRLILDPPAVAAGPRGELLGVPWRDALRTRVFWLLFGSILLLGCATSGGIINLNILLIERGVSPGRASFVLGLVGIAMIVARLAFGTLLDRVRPQPLTSLICAIVGVAFVILAASADPVSVMVAALLIGVGFGAEGDALSYMASRAFGMRDFGTIFGVIFLAFTGGGALGPVFFALFRSHYGNYSTALWTAAAICGVSAILALLIRDDELPFGQKHKRGPTDRDRVAPIEA